MFSLSSVNNLDVRLEDDYKLKDDDIVEVEPNLTVVECGNGHRHGSRALDMAKHMIIIIIIIKR